MLLYDEWISEDIRKEIKEFLEANENKETTYQNVWDTMKPFLEENLFHGTHSIKEEKNQQINDLTLQLKALEKEDQHNTKKK